MVKEIIHFLSGRALAELSSWDFCKCGGCKRVRDSIMPKETIFMSRHQDGDKWVFSLRPMSEFCEAVLIDSRTHGLKEGRNEVEQSKMRMFTRGV